MADAKPQFTPGPWKFDEVRTQSGRAFRMGTDEMLTVGKGCCIIYDDYPGGPNSKQRAANACLIAAAPDLYAAAKLFEESLEYLIRTDKSGDDEGVRLKMITLGLLRETIAKAEGRS